MSLNEIQEPYKRLIRELETNTNLEKKTERQAIQPEMRTMFWFDYSACQPMYFNVFWRDNSCRTTNTHWPSQRVEKQVVRDLSCVYHGTDFGPYRKHVKFLTTCPMTNTIQVRCHENDVYSNWAIHVGIGWKKSLDPWRQTQDYNRVYVEQWGIHYLQAIAC